MKKVILLCLGVLFIFSPLSFSDTGFRSSPVLVATKNSCNDGNDGSDWLRRCDVQKDKEAFFVEENIDSGSLHKSELAAFSMFKTDIGTDHCDLFPSAVQTWHGASSSQLTIHDFGLIENAFESKYVGYDSSTMVVTPTSCLARDGVTTQSCLSDENLSERLMLVASPVWPEPPQDLESIPLPNNGSGVLHLPPGNYKDLEDNTGIYKKIIFEKGTYWFKSIQLGSNGTELDITHGNGVTKINTGFIAISGNVTVNHTGHPDNLQIIASGPAGGAIIFSANNAFNALILAQSSVVISGHTVVKGAITSPLVTINGFGKLIGQSSCFDPPSKDYTLKVTPKIDYSLICERIPVTFTVEDESGNIVSNFNEDFSAILSPQEGKKACWATSANKTNKADCNISGSTFISGEKTLYLDSSDLGVFDVTASSDGLNEIIKEHFEFVPFKFNADTVKVIANKPQNFDVSVLACNGGSPDVVQDYSGSKTLEVSSYILDSPNSNDGIRTDFQLKKQTNPSKIELNFDEGKATTSLKYQEAGAINFTLSDSTFTCPSDFDCNDYPVHSDKLSGVINVESRPWKLAICSDVAVDGNSSGGSALVAAGESFSLKVKPVRYGNNADVCQLPITQNFFASTAPTATIKALDPTLDSPAGGVVGTLSPLLSFERDNHEGSKTSSHYLFENMNYDEVGSIQFNVEVSSIGFYDDIQGGILDGGSAVGRFYPAYFGITKTVWDYPEKQGSGDSSFVYMDQNFTDVDFEVAAYSYLGTQTENYGLFDKSLKASFSLVGEYATRLNITNTDLGVSHWNSGAFWRVNNLGHAAMWSKKEVTAITRNRATEADGPFNVKDNPNSITTELGLEIGGEDPVTFSKDNVITDAELLTQPDVRYGRMVLDSVGTSVGRDVSVPLRVEYWNGNTFVLSSTDGASKFDGEQYCKQTVWPDPIESSSTILKGSNTVIQGSDATNLVADANNSSLREQVRFWLRLASTSPQTSETNVDCSSGSPANEQPWLQYNWRGQGDEDPSTVVTFGIYRGNDRVIFRGESNIIGTSN